MACEGPVVWDQYLALVDYRCPSCGGIYGNAVIDCAAYRIQHNYLLTNIEYVESMSPGWREAIDVEVEAFEVVVRLAYRMNKGIVALVRRFITVMDNVGIYDVAVHSIYRYFQEWLFRTTNLQRYEL